MHGTTTKINKKNYTHIIQFHLYRSVNIYSYCLQEQCCNVFLYILYKLFAQLISLKKVVPIYKEGNRSAVCKQMEHVIVGLLRQVCDTNKWLDEGQHGFRPG